MARTQTAEKTNVKKENFRIPRSLPDPVAIDIEARRSQLIMNLNSLLADEFTLFTKTLNFHWNIEGPRFNSLHEFLEHQYKELLAVVDDVAERIRMLDAYPNGTLNEFKETTKVIEHPGQQPDTATMLSQLQSDHEKVQRTIKYILTHERTQEPDPGTEDFLVSLLRKHEDMTWRLKSHFE